MSSVIGSDTRGQAVVGRDSELVPAASASLQLWDRLGLQLGETALVTAGHRWSRLAALVATWYGAVPVLLVSDDPGATPPGVTRVGVAGLTDPSKALRARLQGSAAVVAAELSGRAEAVDLLLEALPASSRLMLAGVEREPLTIDYYVNVHRKGLHLISTVFNRNPRVSGPAAGALLERARRLLDRPHRAAAGRAALAADAG